jgi:hypothetical protein
MRQVITFYYDGKRRVAFEGETRPHAGGLVCWQIVPKRGVRTYKPAKMLDIRRVGFIKRLFYNLTEN